MLRTHTHTERERERDIWLVPPFSQGAEDKEGEREGGRRRKKEATDLDRYVVCALFQPLRQRLALVRGLSQLRLLVRHAERRLRRQTEKERERERERMR